MAVFTLPWDRDGQTKVCAALKTNNFVSWSERDELDQIEQSLSGGFTDLSESQKAFLEKMIGQYGSSIDI